MPGTKRRSEASEGDDEERSSKVIVTREVAEMAETLDRGSTTVERRQVNKPNRPPEAGIITLIQVENFMCHQKLKVPLCSNVNFINGANGSGKSAILAAIQICLGAGARRTNRARNLRELVRAGTSQAKVRVTLLNGGNDGYKQDIYGDKITVERTISVGSSGYNGFKLLDSEGKEQSRAKKDLEEMLDALNIQVDNPVAVLDQEESKKFLTGKPEEKYAFFMKATELERIDNKYSETVARYQELNDTEAKLRDSVQGLMENVQVQKRRWEQHQELDKLKSKVRQQQCLYAWALVQEAHEGVETAIAEMETFKEKAAAKELELEEFERTNSQPDEEQDARTARHAELIKEGQEQAVLKKNLVAELKQMTAPYKETERQLKATKKAVHDASRKLNAAKKRLQEARDQIAAKAGNAKSDEARRAAKLQKAEEEKATCEGKIEELTEVVSTSLQAREEIEPQLMDAKARAQKMTSRVEAAKSTVLSLQQSGDEFALLGRHVKALYMEVEKAKKARKFKGAVFGPVAKYVKIVPGKEAFAELAELAIGNGVLDRFIVTNDQDRMLLQNMRQKLGCDRDCGIFQQFTARRYNVPDAPGNGIETAASTLLVSEDLVFNCLVDNARIDQLALAKDKDTSEKALLVRGESGYTIRSKNIKKVYYLPQGDHWEVSKGAITLISNEKRLTRKTIGVDRTEALAEAQSHVEQLLSELKGLKGEENRLEKEYDKLCRVWKRAKNELMENDTRVRDLNGEIEEVRAEFENTTDTNSDTAEYEEDVAQAQEDLDNSKALESSLGAKLSELDPDIEEIKRKINEAHARNEKVLKDIATAENEVARFLETRSQTQNMIDKKKKKVDKYREIISVRSAKIEDLETEREELLKQARILKYRLEAETRRRESSDGIMRDDDEAEREPTDEDLEQIETVQVARESEYYAAKIKKSKERVEAEKRRRKISNEDPNVAYEAYNRAKEEFESKMNQIDEISERLRELQQDITRRKDRWTAMRAFLEKKTPRKFDEMLNLNQYSGTLEFSHEFKSLDLVVQKGVNGGRTTDVKGLSGGERSYTTMCLLLALGETLETPFRILDEFDVFLDTAARKLTMNALIHTAKSLEHRQFIFITPQDLSGVQADPKLKIFKMKPPERHNQVGGLQQQTLDFATQE